MNIRRFLAIATLICLIASVATSQNAKTRSRLFRALELRCWQKRLCIATKAEDGASELGRHGWTFALVLANGEMFTDGVQTDHGCVYVGVSPLSCEYELITPRHVRLTMKEGATVIRVGEIELLDDGTTKTTHRVIPSDSPPYVEKTIWVSQK